jgi:N-acetylneuraminic acid mutarotase
MGGGSTIPTSCTTGNCGQPGVYGSLGTAASANVPGARLQGVTWTDLSGNFWLFGGAGVDENGAVAYLNDMWEYQPAATTTTPQAATPAFTLAIGTYATTQSVSITDSTPNPTIYYTTNGTTPTTSSTLYSGTAITVSSTETIEAIATASGYTQSTVASATYTITPVVKTTPTVTVSPSPAGITTAQALSVTVTVSGSPTATGSVVLTSGSYTSTSATLSSGSATIAVPAGSLATGTDTLTASYTPDSNSSAAYNSATGSNTVTVATAPTASNDWTWVGGSSIDPAGTAGQSGVYGTLGTAAAGNVPGGRSDAMSWTDSSGNRWLFGGIGLDANGKVGELNDLWELNPSTNIWTWVSGSNSVGSFLGTNGEYAGQPGVYGTLGVAAAGNTPGSREGASTWVDSKGNLWLFGGFGWDQTVQFESIEFNDLWEFNPSTNQWTWMGGSNTAETDTGQNGVYGTMGTPAAGNIPGSRYNAASWKDSSGNFWLFGGYGLLSNGDLGDMNDLWEFSPSTDQWTWMGGSPTVSSCMRYSSEDIFCEQTGSYGTLGTAAQGNIPPGRSNASTWTDSTGNFWLFGGNSWDQSQVFAGIIYNDLWKFNPASGEWTWVGGSSVPPNCVTNSADECAKLSVYGTLGTPAAGDTPGSRSSAVTWTDSSGNLWLFGGSGYDSAGTLGELSDFWEFNPSTNEWTWIGGSNIANQNGVYGTLGTPAAGNVPGGRTEAVSWTDLNGGFWLFGGLGFPSAGGQSYLNDLWAYRATTTTLPTAATPTVTVSPLPASFSTTQSTTVTVGVSGGNSNPTPTGSVILSGGGYTSASTTLSGGSATITVPAGSLATGTDTLTATYTPDSSSSSTYNSATGSNTVTVTSATVQVTVGTSPTGLSFTVDNTTYTSPQTLSWTVGTTHTIAATSPQVSTGTQNTFTSWSDAGALSHSVTASSSVTSYTANFSTSYQLTPSASPLAGGGVTPTAATYYPAGTVVNLIATPNSGYNFSSWTGNVASAGSASTTITMNAPQSVTANFTSTSAIATLTPPTLTFTAVTGTTSAAQVATLSNTGTATLNITGITVTGTNPTDFTITTGANACGTTLAVGASCSIYVTFTPASATSFAATLLVADNANTQAPAVVHHAGTEATQAGSTQSLSLVGNGTAPATPAATLTPPTLTFASTTGTTSAPQIATLANTGTATLNISGITITGTNPSDFAITTGTNACGTTLAASSSCSIYVTFTPASAATFSATLSVADNASGSPQTSALSGTGTSAVTPTFTVSSTTTPQTIQPGSSAQYTITVAAQNGAFSNPVTLAAIGLPTGATPTFSPASITPGSTSANSTLTIQTPAIAMNTPPRNPRWPLTLPVLALISFLFLPGKRRRRWITLGVLLIASLSALTALSGCGGGFAITKSSQSYTITVTGTSGADVQTTTVQLTVQ